MSFVLILNVSLIFGVVYVLSTASFLECKFKS